MMMRQDTMEVEIFARLGNPQTRKRSNILYYTLLYFIDY